jgi:hypothetical protein
MLAASQRRPNVAEMPCPHCGEVHATSTAFCPKTGAAMPAAGAAPSAPGLPEKGVFDILGEAWKLYKTHARALILTCAVLFVPASVVKSCAFATFVGPAIAAGSAAAVEGLENGDAAKLEASKHALQEAYQRHADRGTIERLQAEQARLLESLGRRSMAAASAAMGDFTTWVLRLFGSLVVLFIYLVTLWLTNGALTIAVADRATGGSAAWREVWMLLLRRVGPLLIAVILVSIIVAFGTLFFVIPGLILGLLFAFVPQAVLIEGLRGREALKRSVELVSSDWLRVAIMIIALGALSWAAQLVAHAFMPASAFFASSFFGDLVTLVLLPVPVLGMVLLYFDIRRKRDGFTDDRLRTDLEALKTA